MELRAVSGVEFIAPISRARANHAEGRRRGFHHPDLHSRSVRPKQTSVWEIKCVLFIARRMVGCRIQRIKAVPLRFQIGTFGEREAHSSKNLNSTLMHLVKRMQRTDLMRRSWQGNIDLSEPARFFL